MHTFCISRTIWPFSPSLSDRERAGWIRCEQLFCSPTHLPWEAAPPDLVGQDLLHLPQPVDIKSWEERVTQLCPTFCDPMDYIQNHGILQARILEWVAFPFSRGSSQSGSNPGLQHFRWILYLLSHKGSPRILKWVAYPFPKGSSQPKSPTRVSCIAGGFFTKWAIREKLGGINSNGQLFINIYVLPLLLVKRRQFLPKSMVAHKVAV